MQRILQYGLFAVIALAIISRFAGGIDAVGGAISGFAPLLIIGAIVAAAIVFRERVRQPSLRTLFATLTWPLALLCLVPAVAALAFTSGTGLLLGLVPLFLISWMVGTTDEVPRKIHMVLSGAAILGVLVSLFVNTSALDRYMLYRLGPERAAEMMEQGLFVDSSAGRIGNAVAYIVASWGGGSSKEPAQDAPRVSSSPSGTSSNGFQDVIDNVEAERKYAEAVDRWEHEYRGGVKVARALHAIDRAIPEGAPTFNMDVPAQAAKASQYGKPHWRLYPSTGSWEPQGYIPESYTGISGMPKRPEPAKVRRPTPTPQAAQPAPTARPTASATPVQVSTTGDAVTMPLTVGDIVYYRASTQVSLEGPLGTSTHPAYTGPQWWRIQATVNGAYTLRGATEFMIQKRR